MRISLLAVGLTAVSLATMASADPIKASAGEPGQPGANSVPMVVAAATETIGAPAASDRQPQQQAADPAKPVRRARVTSCRCGDQTPSN